MFLEDSLAYYGPSMKPMYKNNWPQNLLEMLKFIKKQQHLNCSIEDNSRPFSSISAPDIDYPY